MSRKGNCWDNACVESFFGTLKRELVYQRRSMTRSEAIQDIFEYIYIEVFYNRQRRYLTLGYHSPAEYEASAAVAYPGVRKIAGKINDGTHRHLSSVRSLRRRRNTMPYRTGGG